MTKDDVFLTIDNLRAMRNEACKKYDDSCRECKYGKFNFDENKWECLHGYMIPAIKSEFGVKEGRLVQSLNKYLYYDRIVQYKQTKEQDKNGDYF